MAKQLRSRESLYRLLADRLRDEIFGGNWTTGEQIPTEGELVREYGVSRATVRQALSVLEHEGFIITKHGAGRFIARPSDVVSAGLEQLSSISVTIAAQGRKPGVRFLSKKFREGTAEEAEALGLKPGDEVFEVEREFTADGQLVVYSQDVLPTKLLPAGFKPDHLKGPIFEFLEKKCGVSVKTAYARLHAVREGAPGWNHKLKDALFLRLDQTHFSDAGESVLFSSSYYVQGRFNFTVVRTR
ncbi:MAG: GntR family transcriptional regulator [Actinomycetota bacterium]